MGANYAVFQEEIGEQGTYHLQGYVQLPQQVRFSELDRADVLPGAHWEVARGTPQQNEDYCTKEATRVAGPYRFGERRGGKGTRNDILALRDAIKGGVTTEREIFERDELVGPAIRYPRAVQRLASAYAPPVQRDSVVVTLHYGPAGKKPSPRGAPGFFLFFINTYLYYRHWKNFLCPL